MRTYRAAGQPTGQPKRTARKDILKYVNIGQKIITAAQETPRHVSTFIVLLGKKLPLKKTTKLWTSVMRITMRM